MICHSTERIGEQSQVRTADDRICIIKDAISGKVLADELTSGAEYAVSKEWNINGENAVIAVERV